MVKHKGILVICGLAGAFLAFHTLSSLSGVPCKSHRVDIVNRSSKTVRITGIRWLETRQQKWIKQKIEPALVPARSDWSTVIDLAGLTRPETYLIVDYQILRAPSADRWSEKKSTSQRRVASCLTTRRSDIPIVDLRASL